MKKKLIAVLGCAVLLVCAIAVAQNTANYMEQGGARWVIGSGGSIDVASGGELDIESGGALKIAGTAVTATAAELNAAADVTTPGTVEASKGVVVDSNKDITGFRNVSGTGTVDFPTISNATLVLESLNPATIKLNDTNALQLDNAAISAFAAAADVAGTDVYIETQDGGADTAVDGAIKGGDLSIKTGDAGAAGADMSGAAGGSQTIAAGAGSAGGAHTANNPNGGNGGTVTISAGTGGAAGAGGSGVAGDPGKVKIGTGTFHFVNAQTLDMSDAQVALTLNPGTPAGTTLTSNVLYADANSTGIEEDLLLMPEADANGLVVLIKNTGGENIRVREDADSTTIGYVRAGNVGIFACDGTTWTGGEMALTTANSLPLLGADFRDGATYELIPDAEADDDGFSLNTGTIIQGDISNGVENADEETTVGVIYARVPDNYVTGTDLTFHSRAKLQGVGTVADKSIDVTAYVIGNDGAAGADICATAAGTIDGTSYADEDFTITGTTVTPGALLLISITTVVDNTNSTNVQSQLTDFELRYTANK